MRSIHRVNLDQEVIRIERVDIDADKRDLVAAAKVNQRVGADLNGRALYVAKPTNANDPVEVDFAEPCSPFRTRIGNRPLEHHPIRLNRFQRFNRRIKMLYLLKN